MQTIDRHHSTFLSLHSSPSRRLQSTPEDLASKTGLEPEQAREIMARLEKAKLLTVLPDGVVIADPNRLRKYLEYLSMKEHFEGME